VHTEGRVRSSELRQDCSLLTERELKSNAPQGTSEQQVHSKVSLRRAVAAVQRCGVGERVRADHQGSEKRHDAQAACKPGGGGCG
jgi:hypothetical protein